GSTCQPGGNATNETWWLDLSSNSWNQKASMPGAYADFWELSMISDYDPVSGRVIMVGNHQSGDFNPLTNTWRLHDNGMAGIDQNTTGALDPVNRKFVSIGSNTAYIFSVDATGFMGGRSNLNSTGAKDMESRIAP